MTTRLYLLFTALILISTPGIATESPTKKLSEFVSNACRLHQPETGLSDELIQNSTTQSPIKFRGMAVGTRYHFEVEKNINIELEVIKSNSQISRIVGTIFKNSNPVSLISLDADCQPQVMRQMNFDDQGEAVSIVNLDKDLMPRGEVSWLNPPLVWLDQKSEEAQEQTTDSTPVRVAMIDSGVNYHLAEINRGLARDADGKLIGYDFWDMDALPYDAHPAGSSFFVQRHGTRTASILLREAPGVMLAPYRYPRPDMSRMQALIEHASRHQVIIVGMPLGSNRKSDWNSFERVARNNPHMLFIVSAGNNGRNIDDEPVYPASLDLDNVLVVTSADDFVAPAERTNWGRFSVDYLVPAERIAALDYSGSEISVSGSSYAVARVAALAARLQQTHRHWQAKDIIAELQRRYSDISPSARRWVRVGYIGDPLASGSISAKTLPAPEIKQVTGAKEFALSLDILVLDPNWTRTMIEQSLQQAFDILSQCGITSGAISLRSFEGPDYLRDLDTGAASTLMTLRQADIVSVVFARDTRMWAAFDGEAFGLGNTVRRPWLSNSVWLMRGVDDPGVALAHEIFHVMANDGSHYEAGPNLMQGRTRPDSVSLTEEQCWLARSNGVNNQLLETPLIGSH